MPRERRQLSPQEKWEVFLEVTSQQLTQADAARKWNVDVSTVIRIRQLAKDAALAAFAASKPGRMPSPEQAHVESFFSHLKGDWPHLTSITDPAALDTELARIRRDYNTVRLHASIGYVTPDDEHHGRGPAIRRARIAGLKRAHAKRIKQNRRRAR